MILVAGLFAPLPLCGKASPVQHALQQLPFLLSANFALDAQAGRRLCGLHDDVAPLLVEAGQVCPYPTSKHALQRHIISQMPIVSRQLNVGNNFTCNRLTQQSICCVYDAG